MPTEVLLVKDHPMRRAWDTYHASEDYKNSERWALRDAQYIEGAMWAAFCAGWNTRASAPAATETT